MLEIQLENIPEGKRALKGCRVMGNVAKKSRMA